ncbi:MAG: NUDIX hydrolase [Theionarchaea archaeon]|nr:NUDIX hydrolase [Theionarchaea archaeon]MBU7036964.1 NUDIX hydrolase [Theionarchaea archaeon]
MREKRIAVAVDGVVIEGGRILLIRRGKDPFRGFWALPGGFVEYGESTEHAVVREVEEETGLLCRIERLLGVYSAPDRDPRGHVISVAYVLSVKEEKPTPGDDSAAATWFSAAEVPDNIAFDHLNIIRDALTLRSL